MTPIPQPKRKYQVDQRVSFKTHITGIGDKNLKGTIVGSRITGADDCGWIWHYSIKADEYPGAHPFQVLESEIS